MRSLQVFNLIMGKHFTRQSILGNIYTLKCNFSPKVFSRFCIECGRVATFDRFLFDWLLSFWRYFLPILCCHWDRKWMDFFQWEQQAIEAHIFVGLELSLGFFFCLFVFCCSTIENIFLTSHVVPRMGEFSPWPITYSSPMGKSNNNKHMTEILILPKTRTIYIWDCPSKAYNIMLVARLAPILSFKTG